MGKNAFPVIDVSQVGPAEHYYSDSNGHRYSVARLFAIAADLEPFDIPLAGLNLDSNIWDGCNILELAKHCKQVFDADLSYPIIIDWSGQIADGRHRIIKALIDGRTTIKAVRMIGPISPCKEAE